jgi:DNA-binding CsgD family transcriptional regulator
MLAIGAFLMQFTVQGAWGVVPVHLNELSPDNARGRFPASSISSAICWRRSTRRCRPACGAGRPVRANPSSGWCAVPEEREFLGLIGQIYDAAIGDQDWVLVLDDLSEMLGGAAAVLQRPFDPGQPVETLVSGIDLAYVALYGAYYHEMAPLRPWLRRVPGGSVFVDRMLVPDDAYVRSEFYTDFLAPQDQHASLTWVDHKRQPKAGSLPGMISVWRPRRAPQWEPQQLRLLSRLAPHLGQAMEIEHRLGANTARRTAIDLLQTRTDLTWRERDCLALIARGASSSDIARQLALPAQAVNEHVDAAMRKLQATSRSEAVAMALVLGLLEG